VTTAAEAVERPVPTPRTLRSRLDLGDVAFRALARAGGGTVLLIMVLVGTFLGLRAMEALKVSGWSFLTEQAWEPDAGHFGIRAVLLGTVLIGVVAVCVALPLSIGTALYISEYAPHRLSRSLVSLVDLMAAVPSVVYGLWGFAFLQGTMVGLSRWIATYFGWFPLFRVDGSDPRDPLATSTVYTSSTFIAGVVVGLMITPVMSSVMREVFSAAPMGEREGAYALGATRWTMIRAVVLPFGRGGMIGGTMLGLGRALGETIAVYMIIAMFIHVQPHILQNGGSSISALIASKYGEATHIGTSALMAAGLPLFLVTLGINFIASSIVARTRSGAESDV